MGALRAKTELMVVRGPQLTKEQLRLKAPARLRRFVRKSQLRLVPPPKPSFSSLYRFSLMLVLAIALALPALAAEQLTIELHGHSALSGSFYTVGDVASFVSGPSALWDNISAEPLGYCPGPGKTITLADTGLLGILADRGYDWRQISVSGAQVAQLTGATQSIPASAIAGLLKAKVEERLGVATGIIELRPIEERRLPAGRTSVEVRFPDKAGVWLPDAIEFYVDGRLQGTLPLAQYISFELPVVIAPEQIPGRVNLSAGMLGTEVRELRPGAEVVVDAGSIIELETRGSIGAGRMVLTSRLKMPWDVKRGDEVTLLIVTGGVVMRARAEALNNAYTGQSLLVSRFSDGERFTGTLGAEKNVVVE